MGMFTWVKPDNTILPAECRNMDGWQTKDVVGCHLNTLEITADGQLIHIWNETEWQDTPGALLGGYFAPTVEHRDVLDYHGDMVFYTSNHDDPNTPDWDLIGLKARFTEGKLQWIKSVDLNS